MILTAFGLGIALGFLFFELTGLTAGGIIVPGYIALFVDQPARIVATLAVSGITFGIVRLAATRLIIFGRRRFLLMILIGFLLKAMAIRLAPLLAETGMDLQVIGYIIPGLIANEFYRQGVWHTIAALTIVTALVYFLLQTWY